MEEVRHRLNAQRGYLAMLLRIDADPTEFLTRVVEGAFEQNELLSTFTAHEGVDVRAIVDLVMEQYYAVGEYHLPGDRVIDKLLTMIGNWVADDEDYIEWVYEHVVDRMEANAQREEANTSHTRVEEVTERRMDLYRKRRKLERAVRHDVGEQVVLMRDDRRGWDEAERGPNPYVAQAPRVPMAMYRAIYNVPRP